MKLSIARLFDVASIAQSKSAQELQPFINHVNTLTDQVVSALANQLTFNDNFRCDELTAELVHEKTVPVKVKTTSIKGVISQRVLHATDALRSLAWTTTQAGQLNLTAEFKEATTVARTVSLVVFYN